MDDVSVRTPMLKSARVFKRVDGLTNMNVFIGEVLMRVMHNNN
jgi:hypothetical protein